MSKKIILNLAFVMLLALQACKTEDFVLGPPPSKVEGISDTWVIETAAMVDELSPTKKAINLNQFYLENPMEITFNADPKTYEVKLGSGKNFLGTNGTWSFDDPDFPEKVILVDNNNETHTLSLQSPTRPVDKKFRFKYTILCDTDPAVSYSFQFARKPK